MSTVFMVLVMLSAVLGGSVLGRLVPAIPAPLVQIALGIVMSMVTSFQLRLDPEIFFLLLVAPLLFVDGWRLPKDALFRYGKVILGLALGLVFVTVLVVGPVIAWLIPGIPLPVAFALAAALAPTDPLAIGALSRRLRVPTSLLHVLEGEGLLNDASALVCLRISVAVALGAAFDPVTVLPQFVYTAVGGAVVGVAVSFAGSRLTSLVTDRLGEDVSADVLMTLMLPLAAYLGAEAIHASGVLAAAAAGIAMMLESPAKVPAGSRLRRSGVWDMLRSTLNGFVFVLLGLQLVGIAERGTTAMSGGWPTLILWGLAITALLLALRFAWGAVWLRMTLLRHRRTLGDMEMPSGRVAAVATFAGARGAITLAAALTLPALMPNGTPVPGRDLVVALAAIVVVVTLVLASISLPRLLQDLTLPSHDDDGVRQRAARVAMAEAGERQLRVFASVAEDEGASSAAVRLAETYRLRARNLSERDGDVAPLDIGGIIQAVGDALAAERAVVIDLRRDGRIGDVVADRLLADLDLRTEQISLHRSHG